jgi:outer membrane lipoprotein SlyB
MPYAMVSRSDVRKIGRARRTGMEHDAIEDARKGFVERIPSEHRSRGETAAVGAGLGAMVGSAVLGVPGAVVGGALGAAAGVLVGETMEARDDD